VKFLVKSDILNRAGFIEVYDCLIQIGKEKLGSKIVEIVVPSLDSLKICSVIFSVRLCSEFAGKEQIGKMVGVLQKSMKEYYGDHHIEIERRLCSYFERIRDPNSLPHLLNLLRFRREENTSDKSRAIASVLNAHPYKIDDVLDVLYDVRDEKKLVDAILFALDDVEKANIDTRKLLSKIRIRYWFENPTGHYVRRILVRGSQSSKPILFGMLKDEEKYDYALECLKEIGFSTEELSQVFPKPPMLRIYNFLYSQTRARKMPKNLNTLWDEKEKLGENVPGTTDKLEHLVLHLLSSFNFVTLNVAPLKLESVDIVGFYPETFDLLIISCTTGVMKDDIAKLDATVNEMEREIPELFDICTVTPVVVSSKDVAIDPSHLKYSREQGIAILQDYDIDKLLEILSTNRKPREVLRYIAECKWKYVDTSGDN